MNIKDERGIEWELFMDACYFDLYCVKPVDIKDFESIVNFHFISYEDAKQFIELIGKSR